MYVWHVDYTYKNIWVCANERQDDEPAPVNTRQTLMSSGNRTPTSRQTDDRQTDELIVCMYVCIDFFAMYKCSIIIINIIFFGVEGTSLPRHPTYQHPLHYFQTFGIRSFSDYQNVFKRFQITGLLSA